MDRQRIDKWLWHARVVRTRSAAAALVGGGLVRLNSERVEQPSRPVRPGDVVTIALDRNVRILKVTGYAERRGSADIARGLFEDLTPPPAPQPPAPASGAARARVPAARPSGSAATPTGCAAATDRSGIALEERPRWPFDRQSLADLRPMRYGPTVFGVVE